MSANTTPFKVLVAGCSYGGIAAVVNLLDLCAGHPARGAPEKVPHEVALKGVPIEIHIVDERDGYLHLIGCPLAFASNEHAPKMWLKFEDIPALQNPRVRWTQGSLTKIEHEKKIASIQAASPGQLSQGTYEYEYDFFIAATGLKRNYPVVPQALSREHYLLETATHIASIQAAASTGIAVIGGGAVGIEMAAELKITHPSTKVTLIHSRPNLLSSEPLPDAFRTTVLAALQELNITTILGRGRVSISTPSTPTPTPIQRLTFPDGTHLDAAHTIHAVSPPSPTTSYLSPSTLSDEGLVKIDELLRFAPDHYAIGDIARTSGIKRCGAALHMGYLAASGIHQRILQALYSVPPTFVPWPEVGPMIALAVGRKAATFSDEGGVQCSEELMRVFFGEDLGFGGIYKYLKLGELPGGKGVAGRLPQSAPYREMRGVEVEVA